MSVFTLSYGQVALGLDRVTAALFAPADDPVAAQIVRDIRAPRVLTGLLAGAALGVSGVLMQALFRNPMADAWSLGLLAGGQLGVALIVTAAAFAGPAAISFLTAFQGIGLTTGALIGVALFAAAMAALSRRVGTITLLVVGLMLGFTVQGLVSVIIHFANRVGGRVYSGWNDGTFAATTFDDLGFMVAPVALGLVVAIASAKGLSALLLGETYAR
ncbi:MAG: iron ABC transporter permease, partial [Caulobacterales bacterium]|nr:iron ABC transporter permease [Caulobacterales bacterium]